MRSTRCFQAGYYALSHHPQHWPVFIAPSQYLEFLQSDVLPYLNSVERKSLRQQWQELRQLQKRYRCLPYHYLKYRLYERSASPEFLDYLPASLMRYFRRDHNPAGFVHLLNDKVQTTRVVSAAGVRCVQTLLSVSARGDIERGDGLAMEPDAAVEALRGAGGILFVKPIDSRAGLGAFKIPAVSVDTAWVESLRNVVVQPALRNHPVIESLYRGALNTVRVATYVKDGRCTLIAAALRIAHGNAVVDNCSQGAMAVGIDLKRGTLNRTAMTIAKFGRRVHVVHPDTKVAFAAITLPWWRETCELAERAALALQPHTVLGLDIAFTADGPVFIEGNAAADLCAMQEVCGPLAQSQLGRAILAHWLKDRATNSSTL